MNEIGESIEREVKNAVRTFREIAGAPQKILNPELFPPRMRLLLEYFHEAAPGESPALSDELAEDRNVPGLYTPFELILNPISMRTAVARKLKPAPGTSASEEKDLFGTLLKVQAQLAQIKAEGRENNRHYMETPSKIEGILLDMGVGADPAHKITEFISALIMEVRSYKLDHARVFIRLDEIKKENRSLTSDERRQLGLDEILQRQKEIKDNTDKLLVTLNGLIKTGREQESFKDKFRELNYALKNTIEILPTIDYENIKMHGKLVEVRGRLMREREQRLGEWIRNSSAGSMAVLKRLIEFVYAELLWDSAAKKIRIGADLFPMKPGDRMLKTILGKRMKIADPAFFQAVADSADPPCRIVVFQNPGKCYYNENLRLLVVHNFLTSGGDAWEGIKGLAGDFAHAVTAAMPRVLDEFKKHLSAAGKPVPEESALEKFHACYADCFADRFSPGNPEGECAYNPDDPCMNFFTSRYFSTKRRLG